MGSKNCVYMLRTMRQLQPCKSGMTCPKFTRNYRLEATLPLLSDALTMRLALHSATVPIRYISHETPPCSEAKNMTSDWRGKPLNGSPAISDVNHVSPLNEHIRLKPDELSSSHKMCQSSTMTALNECTTPREVLDVFSSSSNRNDEVFKGVLKLWHTFLALDEKQKLIERDVIVGHPHFLNLTQEVWKKASVLPPGTLIHMLYVFVRLKINQQSRLIQDLLVICQQHLSNLNEVELAILANTLEWLSSDKNVDMLKFGLRLLVDMKIEELNEVTPLLTVMKAVGRIAPLRLKLKLENKALEMVDRFNVTQSESIFCVLADIHFYSEQLLDACSRKLIDIDELSYAEIVSLLSCCCELNYSNERLLTVLGNQIMKTICLWKPLQLAMILHYFAQLRFRHVPLLDRYADIFTSNLNSVNIWDLSEATKVYSVLNHLPEKMTHRFLEAVNTSLQAHLDSIPPEKLHDIIYNLCVLGICPDIAINKLLQYENSLNLKEHGFLMHSNLSLMANKPFSNSHSLHFLKKVAPTTSEDIVTFHTDMKDFIKNPDLYQYSMQLANTYYIDFILALDIQENELVPVGDIQTADCSENIIRIAVLCCTPNAFALGTLHPLGHLALKIRNIKSSGFSVVVVPVHRFVEMTEKQRVEFLKTVIFYKLSDNQNAHEDPRAKGDLQQPPHHI
ncbi:FAST kinase domain-containing protein 2, mitochondrial isoform 2-T3 [Mantella aurantiaca]